MSARRKIPELYLTGGSALIPSYSHWIKRHIDSGWEVYLFIFRFDQLVGTPNSIGKHMRRHVSNWFDRLVARTVGAPCPPKGIFVSDLPVLKSYRPQIRDVVIKNRPCIHGLVTASLCDEIDITMDEYFAENIDQYVMPGISYVEAGIITRTDIK